MILSSLLSPIIASGRLSRWQEMALLGENLSKDGDRANEQRIKLFKMKSERDYRFHSNDNSIGIAVKSITISGRCRFPIAVPK